MSELENIKFEDVNVGDIICVPYSVSISWVNFRYPYFVETTVTRVTPKNTKISTDKCGDIKITDRIPIYKPSDETRRQSKVSTAYKLIGKCLSNLDTFRRNDNIRKLDDDTIVKISVKLKEISDIILKKED